ncbi:SDR family NAD(P)-dependent oxidoreductase [Mycolicibacterium boenickei]|nr:SDR family NAD(P)-dependent oxidoreductase [Mycolicibacterium boenickei]
MSSVVWITGATAGIGSGLAATVPYPDVRVVNLSRSVHPELETVQFDLTRPDTYAAVANHFEATLRDFDGERAIFIHNAYYPAVPGFVAEGDPSEYAKAIQANVAAPLLLGEMFLRFVRPGYESGLVLMSSAGARHPFEGLAHYCAGKSAVEMWVRVVRRELARRNRDTWVVAVRPGFVDTPTTRMNAQQPAESYPVGPEIGRRLDVGTGVLTPEQAGRDIWAGLLDRATAESVLLFGEMVPDSSPGRTE